MCACGLFDFLILKCSTDILQFSGPAGHGRGGGIEEPEEAQTLSLNLTDMLGIFIAKGKDHMLVTKNFVPVESV